MKTEKWLERFKQILEKEETKHLEVHKAIVKMQFKNEATGEIEIHEWEYIAKDSQHLELDTGGA